MVRSRLTLGEVPIVAERVAPGTNWYEEWLTASVRHVAVCERQWIGARAMLRSANRWPGLLTVAAKSSRERALERRIMNACMIRWGFAPAS